MLVNIEPIQTGASATPNLWNQRFAAITSVINGNIDSDNLKNNAVTREKIAPQSVTSDKLSINKYIDENGWTVSDYGTEKEYRYQKTGTYDINHQQWITIDIPLPVGKTSVDDIVFSLSAISPFAEPIYTVLAKQYSVNGVMRVRVFNAHPSYNVKTTDGQYRIDIVAKDQ